MKFSKLWDADYLRVGVELGGAPDDDAATLIEEHLDEKDTLFEDVVPKHMRYRDIARATDSTLRAIAHDPLEHYLREPARRGALQRAAFRGVIGLQWLQTTAHRSAWTVRRGAATVVRVRAPNDPKATPSPRLKVLDACVRVLAGGLGRLEPKLLQKRQDAFDKATAAAVLACVGTPDALRDMLQLGGLTTHPACQGRGYGSALVRKVTDLADAQGRTTWLLSSNVANMAFYNYLGFHTVGTVYIGLGDPTWTKPPIRVDVMLRKPEGSEVQDVEFAVN